MHEAKMSSRATTRLTMASVHDTCQERRVVVRIDTARGLVHLRLAHTRREYPLSVEQLYYHAVQRQVEVDRAAKRALANYGRQKG